MQKYFHLRVDYRDKAGLDSQLDWLARTYAADRLVVLEEKKDSKPHFHAIFGDNNIMTTVRQHWKKRFPDYDGKFEKDYQLIEIPNKRNPSMIDAERYLCKGKSAEIGPNIAYKTGKYTDEYIAERHAEYWKHGGPKEPEVKFTHECLNTWVVPQSQTKAPRKKAPNFFQNVIAHLELNPPMGGVAYKATDAPYILKTLIKFHGQNFKPYGPQQIENEMNLLLNVLVFQDHYDDIYEKIRLRGQIPHL